MTSCWLVSPELLARICRLGQPAEDVLKNAICPGHDESIACVLPDARHSVA
jgi:hypothetical protein